MVQQFISNNSGAIAGLASSISGNSSAKKAVATQYKYNKALQEQAQQWQEYAARNKWAWDTQSKIDAGINPLYGLGNATVPTATSGSVGLPEMVTEKNNKVQAKLQGIQLGQDFAAKKAEIKLKEQETKTEYYNTQLRALDKINKQIEILYNEGELNFQKKKQIKELEKMQSEITTNLANAEKASAEAGNARMLTQKTKEEITGIKETNIGIKRTNQFYDKHPILGGFITGMKESGGSSYGTITSGAGTLLDIGKKFNNQALKGIKESRQTATMNNQKIRSYAAGKMIRKIK